ncbi:MAG TPA: tRNA (N6-threonylcarbamoyladenosine(37)-N6)-methyltransferase TrmO [Bacillota bacterium]|nr:tRNA (N6-threonylcarbamoyladenosine(37)-N6)-methyltransferase TrmO [Bacillota bacterium]
MTSNPKVVSPIGYVRIGPSGYRLEIDAEYIPALEGLEDFSHMMVLWWGHLTDENENRSLLQVERPYRHAPERMGVFATRSQIRPNPIAVSMVPLVRIDAMEGLIEIPWIDAEDGTPIIDLKPYHPSSDRVREVKLPAWCRHWPEWYEESASFNWETEFINAR